MSELIGKELEMTNMRLPESENHWLDVKNWMEMDPDPCYHHASSEAIEAFNDMKYGVRIHWGLYSLWHLQNESWPFLKMPVEKKQEYQQLYQQFNPTGFNADEWMSLFQRVGLKCFAMTTRHHEGFSLWDTESCVCQRVNYTAPGGPQIEPCSLAYSVMDTPFKRDILRELCDSARKYGIKIDFYYSHPDWYDADFRPYSFHPLQTPRVQEHPEEYGRWEYHESLKTQLLYPARERSPEETGRMLERHRRQLVELLSNYGKIDMLCLDMWLGADVWPQLRETVMMIRKLQPDVLLRARGIGNYGDYYTPEGFVPGSPSNTDMPWMVIYPLARSFSYDPVGENYKGWKWIVKNIVDCAAKGGNFMVGIGADENGCFHPQAVRDLEAAGAWLALNGEAIYATRPRPAWREGQNIRFTFSKDRRVIYAISLRWPGRSLHLRTVEPSPEMRITLLGYSQPLNWRKEGSGIVIELPERFQNPKDRPGQGAFAFRIEASAG